MDSPPSAVPTIDLVAIARVLEAGVPELDAAAAARVQAHLATVGRRAEEWIAEGMRRQAERPPALSNECVFCAQDLAGSPVISHYRSFFSEAYRQLQQQIIAASASITDMYSANAASSFERAVRPLVNAVNFWARFADIPTISVDTAVIAHDWQLAHELVAGLVARKQAAPLDAIAIPEDVRAAVKDYETHRNALETTNQQLQQANQIIAAVKQRAASANPAAISATLSRLQAVRARHTLATAALCDAYLLEKQAKTATEQLRDQARTALISIAPVYFQITKGRLTATSLNSMRASTWIVLQPPTRAEDRHAPTTSSSIILQLRLPAVIPKPGDHSFRNILSSGDRNALALAFFFASLELDLSLATKTIVIDDPISSLDDHRTDNRSGDSASSD